MCGLLNPGTRTNGSLSVVEKKLVDFESNTTSISSPCSQPDFRPTLVSFVSGWPATSGPHQGLVVPSSFMLSSARFCISKAEDLRKRSLLQTDWTSSAETELHHDYHD